MQEMAKYHLALTCVQMALWEGYPWRTSDEHVKLAIVYHMFADPPDVPGMDAFLSEDKKQIEQFIFDELDHNQNLKRTVSQSLIVKARFCTSFGKMEQTADIMTGAISQRYMGEFSPCENVEEYLAVVGSFLQEYSSEWNAKFETWLSDIDGYWEVVNLGVAAATGRFNSSDI